MVIFVSITKFDIFLFLDSLENQQDKTILLRTPVKVIKFLVLEPHLDYVCLNHQIENHSCHNDNIAKHTKTIYCYNII